MPVGRSSSRKTPTIRTLLSTQSLGYTVRTVALIRCPCRGATMNTCTRWVTAISLWNSSTLSLSSPSSIFFFSFLLFVVFLFFLAALTKQLLNRWQRVTTLLYLQLVSSSSGSTPSTVGPNFRACNLQLLNEIDLHNETQEFYTMEGFKL